MKLSDYEIKSIKETIKKYDIAAEVYLFGSRTENNPKGWDND